MLVLPRRDLWLRLYARSKPIANSWAVREVAGAVNSFPFTSELDPSAAQPLTFLGELYLKKSDFERAIASF